MVRQYVGARYVPKFADPVAWTSGTSYEAMTIVTYNNSSYTSKIPVPATVGNPADNPKYWALTGNYNAQVEEYRQETQKVAGDIETERNRATSAEKKLSTDINTLNNTLSTNIINLGTFKNASLVAFGDSWVNPTTEFYGNWVETCANMLGCTKSYNFADGGSGFAGLSTAESDKATSINAQVEYARNHMTESEKNSVRYVAVIGGTNDFGYTNLTMVQWCENVQIVLIRAQQTFPNAKVIHLINNSLCAENPAVPNTKNDVRWNKLKSWIPDIYSYRLTYSRFDLIPAMLSGNYYGEDWLHPSDIGVAMIACLFAALFNGSKIAFNCDFGFNGTYETNPTDNIRSLIHTSHDGDVTVILEGIQINSNTLTVIHPNIKLKTIFGYVNHPFGQATYTAYNINNTSVNISAGLDNTFSVINTDSYLTGEQTVNIYIRFKMGA